MSLVGNLEDLSLGDIMQIISLSQKTGVLVLRSPAYGSGRVVFRAGLVCAACLDGRSEPVEDDDAALQAEVEAIVLHMFSWRSGDFSFDLRCEAEPEDPGFDLKAGLNAQYLAMEGMRVQDEASRGTAAAEPVEPPATVTSIPDPDPEPVTAEEPPIAEAPTAVPPPATEELTLKPEPEPEPEPAPQAEEDPFADWTFGGDEEKPAEEVTEPKEEPPVATNVLRSRPLILIDGDAVFIGWAKEALRAVFQQVHVFQQADQGLARIRQYLIRGEFPVVLISSRIEIDPLCGIQGVTDFVRRLKTQAPRLPIYRLTEEAAEDEPASGRSVGAFDGDLIRPNRECIQAWVKSSDPGAYANLIDPLLVQLDGASTPDRSL